MYFAVYVASIILWPVEDDIPTENDLENYVIKNYAADWYSVGIELDFEYDELIEIEKSEQDNLSRIRKVMEIWLKVRDNWKTLEIALTNVRRRQCGLDPVETVHGGIACFNKGITVFLQKYSEN